MSTNSPELRQVQLTPRTNTWSGGRRLGMPSLALRFSERRLLLVLVDLVMMNGALFCALLLRSNPDFTASVVWSRMTWFVLLSALWIAIATVLNIYDLAIAASVMRSLWTTSGAICLTGLTYSLIPYITPTLPRYRLEALLFPLLALLGVGFWRTLYALVFVQPIFHQRALVVGNSWIGQTLAEAIARQDADNEARNGSTGYHLLGLVSDNGEPVSGVEGVPFLGASCDLVRLARELRPDELVMAVDDTTQVEGEVFHAILDCHEMGVSITTITSLYERLMSRVPLEPSVGQLSVALPISHSPIHRFYLVLRRVLDIVVSFLGCILVLAIAPFVWLANQISSPGPLFYLQRRVGMSGRTYRLVKFRSMTVDAESKTGPIWASESDDRTTPVGRFLRKTRLDEVPQFWNVLKGQMSLIGPRPERPEMVSQLTQEIPFYRARHAIKPGITGWAQVKYKYGASIADARLKLQYDLYYIKHQGLYLDLHVLLRTIEVVLGFKGR